MAAVEVGVGDDGAPRDLVEGDVLRRQVGRGRHRDAVAHALRVAQRPRQRLHAAQAAAHDRGELRDAQPVEQPRLGVDPVLDRHDGEVGAIGLAGRGVGAHRPGRTEARTGVVDADDEEALGIQRLARADHVVPPAGLPGGVDAGDMVAGVERVAHQHHVAALGVQRAVGLVDERVVRQPRAALQRQRLGEVHLLWRDRSDGAHEAKTRRRCEAGTGCTSFFSGICEAPASWNKSALRSSIAKAAGCDRRARWRASAVVQPHGDAATGGARCDAYPAQSRADWHRAQGMGEGRSVTRRRCTRARRRRSHSIQPSQSSAAPA